MNKLIVPSLVLLLAGSLGSWFTMLAYSGKSWWWPILGAQFGCVAWLWITRQPITPWTACLLYDVMFNLAWFSVLSCYEGVRINQAVGALIMLLGFVIASLK